MGIRAIQTVDDVIDALGGTGATARLTSRKPQHVSNWRAEKRLAAETYEILQDQLRARKLKASSILWGITPAPKRRKKPARKV